MTVPSAIGTVRIADFRSSSSSTTSSPGDPTDRPGNRHRARVEIDVGPPEAAALAIPGASSKREERRVGQILVALGEHERDLGGRAEPALLRLPFRAPRRAREADARGRILAHLAERHRMLERTVEHGVNLADRRRRQRPAGDTAGGTEPRVEPVDVLGLQAVQRDRAEHRHEVRVDVEPILRSGLRRELELGARPPSLEQRTHGRRPGRRAAAARSDTDLVADLARPGLRSARLERPGRPPALPGDRVDADIDGDLPAAAHPSDMRAHEAARQRGSLWNAK
jgi:hypothetical protein